jgi:hypothetical protein
VIAVPTVPFWLPGLLTDRPPVFWQPPRVAAAAQMTLAK